MKRIVVLGAKGMAGHVMAEYLDISGGYKVYGVARSAGRHVSKELNVLEFDALEEYLNEVKPDIVVNCIGILVRQSKDDISSAILTNSYLPHFLSSIGRRLKYKLIHISTDCVFSGKEGGYTEQSFRDGDDNYARTKALGEVINAYDLTVRTSIVGPEITNEGTGLLDWFVRQSGEIKGFTNAFWSGVTTLELAKATDWMIKNDVTGLFQLCPEQKISKYDLLRLFAKIWGKDVQVIPYEEYRVDKSLISSRQDYRYEKISYEGMLREMKLWVTRYPSWYSPFYSS